MRGFTLIELMIVTAMILVFSVGAVVNYSTYSERQKVRQAAYEMRNDFRFAQTKATSKDFPSQVCSDIYGYTVSVSADKYEIIPNCSPEGLRDPVATSSAALGVQFSPSPVTSTTFYSLSQGVSDTMSVTVTGVFNSYRVTISLSGFISVESL